MKDNKNDLQVSTTYKGKIRSLENVESVRVSIWEDLGREQLGEEQIGDLPRSYFPNGELKVGDPFTYRVDVSIQMIPPRAVSDEELAQLRSEVEKRMPQGEY
ncbi:MAG: hypothetical protein Q8Q31_05920 [Nanoarchaeota archaeon]|nr:hypothetical protein [Nanoarchaeota archaeon]